MIDNEKLLAESERQLIKAKIRHHAAAAEYANQCATAAREAIEGLLNIEREYRPFPWKIRIAYGDGEVDGMVESIKPVASIYSNDGCRIEVRHITKKGKPYKTTVHFSFDEIGAFRPPSDAQKAGGQAATEIR